MHQHTATTHSERFKYNTDVWMGAGTVDRVVFCVVGTIYVRGKIAPLFGNLDDVEDDGGGKGARRAQIPTSIRCAFTTTEKFYCSRFRISFSAKWRCLRETKTL